MNFGEYVLWGAGLADLVYALEKLVRWIWVDVGEKVVLAVRGVLVCGGVFLISALPDLTAAYPFLDKWGPLAMGALVAGLTAMGFYPASDLIKAIVKGFVRKLSE